MTVAIKIAVGPALTRHGGSNSINVRLLLGPMPTVRPLAQDFLKKDPPFILFSLLILSFLIFLIFVLLSSIYTSCMNPYPPKPDHIYGETFAYGETIASYTRMVYPLDFSGR
jgi:hypothetical protein